MAVIPRATAAFIGFAERGPVLEPTVVGRWEEYADRFGDPVDSLGQPGSYLHDAVRGWFGNGGRGCLIVRLSSGSVGELTDLLRGGAEWQSIDDAGVDVIACPDLISVGRHGDGMIDLEVWKLVQRELIVAAERTGNRMVILDPPPALDARAVREWRIDHTGFDSPFAVLYHPWIKVARRRGLRSVPPCGHIAGVFARAITLGDLMRPPANVRLEGVYDVDDQLTSGEQRLLHPIGINPIVTRSRWGIRPWGTRTLSSNPATREVGRVRLLCGLVRQLDRLAPLDGGVDRAPDELARAATEVLGAVVGTNRERVRVEPATAGATLALGEDVFDFAPHAISGWSWRPGETET